MERRVEMAKPRILTRSFYTRDTVKVAPDLLGKYLIRSCPQGKINGTIVEVEAYRGSDDPASHAFRGLTPRNAPMFGEAGHAYIYFTYGNHYCLNITTQKTGAPGAVLIRAVQPKEGISLMRKFRPNVQDTQLTNGPGKLTKAFAIDKELNEQDMTIEGPLFVLDSGLADLDIWRSMRIGIKDGQDKRWRFYVNGNSFVSKRSGLGESKFR
jgi:DNA-3-methyladenine glycosylase